MLIIHDLTNAQHLLEWKAEKDIVIDSHGKNHYCIGCFGCWLKTPGRCVIQDDYQCMGETLAKAEELLIISRATFGSYSSAIKNVLDRSISYVSPYFVIRKGEMHHKERYHKNLVLSAIFYGEDMTDAEKQTAKGLVEANALNLNGTLKNVFFVEKPEDIWEVLRNDFDVKY